MVFKKVVRICTMCIMALAVPAMLFAETVGVFFDSNVAQCKFAAGDVKAALESKGFTVDMNPLSSLKLGYAKKRLLLRWLRILMLQN